MVEQLERAFAGVHSVRYAIATSSGTTALHIALLAHDVGPGDEVITTAFSFIATVNTILAVGARPVFAEIDPDTFNLDPLDVARRVTSRTKAIMPVHLYGQACDMDGLGKTARAHGLTIIEDACQAVAATSQGRPVGSFGTGAFSLYATKNVMCGEGGLITTNDEAIADRCRLLRNHGSRQRYVYEELGFNFRLGEIGAAIALAQLERLDSNIARRRAIAAEYASSLRGVRTPRVGLGCEHVWHQYTLRVDAEHRDLAATHLRERGVGTGIYYPRPLHHVPHIRRLCGAAVLPSTELAAAEVLSIPIFPQLSATDVECVVEAVNSLQTIGLC